MTTPFDESIQYEGPVADRDEVSANLLNSTMLQRANFADRPGFGNPGVMFMSLDGRDGLGGDPYFYVDIMTGWMELGILQKDLVGEIKDFAGSTVPSGYLACDGAAVSRTTYANLFAAIGTDWGVGNGVTTFNVPDLRRRVTMGAGGVENGNGIGTDVGDEGGEETHTLTLARIPSHGHANPSHGHGILTNWNINSLGNNNANLPSVFARIAFSRNRPGNYPETVLSPEYTSLNNNVVVGDGIGSGSTSPSVNGGSSSSSSVGSNGSHNNTQPTAVVNKIIKT